MVNAMKLSERFIELLKKSLLNELYIENEALIIKTIISMTNSIEITPKTFFNIKSDEWLFDYLLGCKREGTWTVINKIMPDGSGQIMYDLRNITELSHTMIGRKRLDNIQFCVESILKDDIPGDFIETGVWRGGATIFMRGILAANDITNRIVWVADSFEGVPPPSHSEDHGFDISSSRLPFLAVSIDEVKELFMRYGLLDEQVKFLRGWFRDTLKNAPIEKISLLRLDGDLYESTMDALYPLYDKVSPGGYIIVDDYGSCQPCKKAITDFRESRNIIDEMIVIDTQSIFWKKS